MRIALLLFAIAPLTACDTGTTGACNICPQWSYSAEACIEAGKKAGCKKAEIREVTDNTCNANEPPQTHLECAYTDCDDKLECSDVVTYN
jgi:hypothetical protein